MTSNLCEGGPFLLLNLGPGQDIQGGQSILLHRPRVNTKKQTIPEYVACYTFIPYGLET